MKKTNILIYGATGSIGDSVLSLVRSQKNHFNVVGMTCEKNIKKLSKLADEFNTKNIGIANYNKDMNYDKYFPDKKIFFNLDEFKDLIDDSVDIIVFAISGTSILKLGLDIAKSGKVVGIANKECIISLGDIIINLAKLNNTKIIPLDSEHNSIYQLLNNNNSSFESITITGTGGPFLFKNINDFKNIKVEEAVKHPVWKMGKKISVDSATMVNKGLEIIEAKYLFDIDIRKINVLIHPQAIVHGFVSYKDSSIISFMSFPDMRVPISNLLFPCSKINIDDLHLDLAQIETLNFYKVDKMKFPVIDYVNQIMDMGGLAPHGFNYTNDKLVNLFLNKKIKFLDIINFNISTLDKYFAINSNIEKPTIDDIFHFNKWIDGNIYLGE
tara:strand:- start:46 stop:1197 length:1152 start_codon:yes stop_codon:yes gene_type:complete